MLLSEKDREALECIVADHSEGDGFVFGTLIDVLTGLGMTEEVIDEQNADGLAALAQCLLLTEDRLRATAEADWALMKIGAALWCDGIDSALDAVDAAGRALGQTLAARARELAEEGQDG